MASRADTSLLQRFGKPLLGFAILLLLCVVAIAITAQLTRQHIARNERAWFTAQIEALIPAELHDNDLLNDKIEVYASEALGTRKAVPVYRARLKGAPSAVIINSVAPDGYGGPIELLVAVNYAGEVLGVRVLAHHETPGMGDAFAQAGSTWLAAFRGRSLTNPDTRGWNVRKDGGQFEQFTSATISPRAIIQAVQRTLDYYQQNRAKLYQAAASPSES
ncbi:MAG: electron transport complex subunit RsxG [Steroidobacteraceae bacterium]